MERSAIRESRSRISLRSMGATAIGAALFAAPPRAPTTSRPHDSSRLPVARIHQLEPGRAFELAGRVVAGRGVDVALAGLAQEARVEGHAALGRCLLAVLLDEDAADR